MQLIPKIIQQYKLIFINKNLFEFNSYRYKTFLMLMALCIVISFITYSYLLPYKLNFMQFEKSLYSKILLKYGHDLKFEDFYFIFDFISLDGAPRTRFFSNLFLLLDVKFRMYVLQYFPVHSSFSISWIFSIVIIIIFLYLTLKNIYYSKIYLIITFIIYLTSSGFLGPLNMSFHPAKPLGNALIFIGLFLILSVNNEFKCKSNIAELKYIYNKKYLYYSLITFIGLFTDESMIILLFFPIIFTVSPNNNRFLLFMAISLFLYFILILLILPPLINKSVLFNTGKNIDFNFISWAFKYNSTLFNYGEMIKNSQDVFINTFYFHVRKMNIYPVYAVLDIYDIIFYILTLIASLKLIFNKNILFFQFLIATILSIVIQSIILSRHSVHIIHDTFYYGAFISILFSITLSFTILEYIKIASYKFFESNYDKLIKIISMIIVLFLSVHLININRINYHVTHTAWSGSTEVGLTSETVFNYWYRRYDTNYLLSEINTTTMKQVQWFLEDLYESNHKGLANDFFKSTPGSPYLIEIEKNKSSNK